MKIKKELKIGIIAVLAITLLITGVNFLKGSSFFGGDDIYYGYFPESGGLLPASGVTINGVGVGKVLAIEFMPNQPENRRVRIKFNIQSDNVKIPKGTIVKIGSLDFFTKAIILNFPSKIVGFCPSKTSFQGEMAQDMLQQVQAYADPITQKLQKLMVNVNKVVESMSAFWDTTATSEIHASLVEVRTAIKRFSNMSYEMETLVKEEKFKLTEILTNVSGITNNLEKSNKDITAIISNAHKVSDDLVKSDFKTVISDAHKVLTTLNKSLEPTENGKGNLGKLLKDEALYSDILMTNKKLQYLVDDIQVHPERYIRISVFGKKSKGLQITNMEEEKLRKILDSIP